MWIKRSLLALALVIGISACTPAEMKTWLEANNVAVPQSEEDLQAAADYATQWWDSYLAALINTGAPPPPTEVPSGPHAYPWDDLAWCEASGNWATNTGNGYYGGLQFLQSTWIAYGGQEFASYPHLASAEAQIVVAERIVASHGGTYRAWPGCRSKLGLP